MTSEIQQELEENLRHIQRLIAKQEFSVGDANSFLLRYGNFALKMEELEKSRDLLGETKMKSSNITPQEIGGLFIDGKTSKLNGGCFQWKVGITYIKSNFTTFLARGEQL